MKLIVCQLALKNVRIVTRDYGNNANNKPTFVTTDTKLYAPVVTLSVQYNEKLLQQLKTCFKRIINANKYRSDPAPQTRNRNLNHLIIPSFQRVTRLFCLII